MKKSQFIHSSILSLVTVATLTLAQPNLISTVQADALNPANVNSNQIYGFTFTATVLDTNGKVLAGKKVQLFDTTDDSSKVLQELLTDNNGKARFTQLPIGRSISVSVDGKVQGYTLRTSESGSNLAASFTADGIGTVNPAYGRTPLDIYVRNQDGLPLAGKEVGLKDKSGNLIEKLTSDANGLVHFTQKLMEGTYYSYYLAGTKYGETIPGSSRTIYLDDSKSQDSFTFTATILGQEGKLVSGKTVELYDITDGRAVKVASKVTAKAGQAVFSDLPISRNYSVYIDGQNQGYTVRTSQAGSSMAAAFYIKAKGDQTPIYTNIPLTLTVRDQEGQGIANQSVTLYNKQGQLIANMTSDSEGKVVFTDKLMRGTFYTVRVNDFKMGEATPGNNISLYLKKDQIKTSQSKPVSNALTKASSTKLDQQDYVGQSDSHPNHVSSKVTIDTKGNKAVAAGIKPINHSKAQLPKTSEMASSIVSLIGFVIAGATTIVLLAKHYRKNLK
ncbi:cell wall surface anchor family protein [Streptococcus porcinus]|uniref:MSCRAMM family protein n=1 Tax=Streptococcus porcinus TaxID=1340 RepID=UPI0010CACA19|nr:carboxypeptidase-like regulatory domain-containing protein [Streptococcus porcinus]VTS30904.1 cell wall surface anchor family protein [Streptococcus porcinus]